MLPYSFYTAIVFLNTFKTYGAFLHCVSLGHQPIRFIVRLIDSIKILNIGFQVKPNLNSTAIQDTKKNSKHPKSTYTAIVKPYAVTIH